MSNVFCARFDVVLRTLRLVLERIAVKWNRHSVHKLRAAAFPQRKVLVVEHQCAAARGDLSIAIRSRCADQTDMRRIGRVDVFAQRFWNGRQWILSERLGEVIRAC